jgi:acetyl-CoA carboxylase biotin carboxyl carrier protein
MDTPERFAELCAWLAATDIESLELRGPGTCLRLRRGASGVEASASDAQAPVGSSVVVPAGEAAKPILVRAPCVGVLRHRHPLQDVPLAAAGQPVVTGQALALLQIGPTLVPATAPRDAVVARIVARDGEAVGYGDALVELF